MPGATKDHWTKLYVIVSTKLFPPKKAVDPSQIPPPAIAGYSLYEREIKKAEKKFLRLIIQILIFIKILQFIFSFLFFVPVHFSFLLFLLLLFSSHLSVLMLSLQVRFLLQRQVHLPDVLPILFYRQR